MEILGIKWTVELRNVADLKKWDKNPRKISEASYTRLKRKVVEQGMHQALTIDADNTVLSGNQRLQILMELGVERAWCMIPERPLTAEERDQVGIQSNVSEGNWSIPMLASFDTPLLLLQGFNKLQLDLTPPAEPAGTTQHQANCPHCGGGLRLSNRVKKIEKM